MFDLSLAIYSHILEDNFRTKSEKHGKGEFLYLIFWKEIERLFIWKSTYPAHMSLTGCFFISVNIFNFSLIPYKFSTNLVQNQRKISSIYYEREYIECTHSYLTSKFWVQNSYKESLFQRNVLTVSCLDRAGNISTTRHCFVFRTSFYQ